MSTVMGATEAALGREGFVALPAGSYRVGEPGEERAAAVGPLLVGRRPVTTAELRRFAESTGRSLRPAARARLAAPVLDDHPATEVTREDAEAYCAWAAGALGLPVRLPTGEEWEAAARGAEARTWPWGDVFDPERCDCAEAGWGWTVPVDAHPAGASPCGAEQLAGNVWEWTADRLPDGWGVVRGGCWLDHAWGLRASRALPADPVRATATTGFRVVADPWRSA